MIELVIIATVGIGIVLVLGRSSRRQTRRSLPSKKSGTARYRSSSRSAPPSLPQSRELKGRCHIIDGDTVIIRGVKVRLAGIDAPELNEPFGQKSKWAMVSICKGQIVTAKLNGETSHDRLVGTCYLPDGRDIGAELISQGLAVDWGMLSGGKYRNLEPVGTRRKLRRPPFNR